MSKGNSGSEELAQARLRHLPFVVVGAVARCAAFLILATTVQAQVPDRVVALDSIAVVDQFLTSERAAKVFRHGPAVPKYKIGLAFHSVEHRQIFIGNQRGADGDVSAMLASPDITDVYPTLTHNRAHVDLGAWQASTRKGQIAFHPVPHGVDWHWPTDCAIGTTHINDITEPPIHRFGTDRSRNIGMRS